eukprot:1159192-Pelagomonas_calceolata.AAC.2
MCAQVSDRQALQVRAKGATCTQAPGGQGLQAQARWHCALRLMIGKAGASERRITTLWLKQDGQCALRLLIGKFCRCEREGQCALRFLVGKA